ncbi:FadR/GntR family transcriptional regulator [Paenarthrobacter nitroguajacolicus]|uniref:FadR/GntR family transcriptional regulator n=1 Tax=Paenarthrobacter nitroguajacolicus TaxID=211146 RepID=UPI001AE5811D|nr:GntR family transcriptional regulator [Paenarthrobacter nitroguajacolicus]MDR6639438.1 GntR family transcriptional repressor for pyruvate dehydrogenase complex [Paenarthrobacter nitroguajacolicus]
MANELLTRIRRGEYTLGTRLPSERVLADEFGVSRPVIREALGTLAAMEVIESQMGRGSFVISTAHREEEQELDVHGLIDIVRMREVLESGALSVAESTGVDEEGMTAVRAALDDLRAAVATGANTIEADVALHRAIVAAARSEHLLKLFDDAYESILRSIQFSPRANTMGAHLLDEHEAISAGILDGDYRAAIMASHLMHAEHRKLLSRLLDD